MRASKKAIELIKSQERFSSIPYYCSSGVLTIGYGTTGDVKQKDVISKEDAEKRIIDHVVSSEQVLSRIIKVPLSQNQFDAIISLVYNIGEGTFMKSNMLVYINNNEFDKAAVEFSMFVWGTDPKTKKKIILDGLVKRRQIEAQIFVNSYKLDIK